MRKQYKLTSGSFCEGFGVSIYDMNTNDFYHKIVFQEADTKKLYVNMETCFNPIRVYEEEININNK